MEAAGRAFDADVDGDGLHQAGCDEASAVCVEVQECVGGLAATDPGLVAEADNGVGESGVLLRGVDLLVQVGERVPAPVGVVMFDRFAQALEVGADQSWQRDQERQVLGGISCSERWSSARSRRDRGAR